MFAYKIKKISDLFQTLRENIKCYYQSGVHYNTKIKRQNGVTYQIRKMFSSKCLFNEKTALVFGCPTYGGVAHPTYSL